MRQDPLGYWQVWVANTDLSAARQLTHENANSGWPVWSPNGRKIAFDSDRTDPNLNDETFINDVFTMNPDGSSVTQLTDSRAGSSGDPGWSPDGSLIAYQSDGGAYPEKQGIYVMRADGSHVRRVTTLPAGLDADRTPRFSPDGRRLVFTRYTRGQGASALFTTDLRGRHTNQITSFAIRAGDAVWSPHGEKIVFEAAGPELGSRGNIYVVNSNGKHLRNLTRFAAGSGDGAADPVWSPDGRKNPLSSRPSPSAELSRSGSGHHEIRRVQPSLHRGPADRKPPTGLGSPENVAIGRGPQTGPRQGE